jgi:hypothetical protein
MNLLNQLRDIIQIDVGNRGLRKDPEHNLINAYPDDLARACESLAAPPRVKVVVVTGFFIPTATPPAGETDGPLGALFLARALPALGIHVVLATDDFCIKALRAGLAVCGIDVPLFDLAKMAPDDIPRDATHLLAIERAGPSHHDGRCYTMRGRDITDCTRPAHELFNIRAGSVSDGEPETPSLTLPARKLITIGIGDGGNEIGMGKISRDVIARNIPNGDLVACRVPTDHLIVCGVSNWGAYALAAGVAHLKGKTFDPELFDPKREKRILEAMVEAGPLVDGVTGKQTATIDGLTWEEYAKVLTACGLALASSKR